MTDSQPDLRQLIVMLGDATTRETVPSKLHLHEESSVEPLIAALHDPDENIRHGAAWVIHRIHNSVLGAALSTPALEPLLDLLQHDDSARVRQQAQTTLLTLTDQGDRSILAQPFIAALQDEHEPIRSEAARWLAQFGGPQAVEPLRAVSQNDSSEKVRGRAAYALAYLEPDLETLQGAGEAGIEALMTATKDSERSIRLRAIWALGNLQAASAVQLLTTILEGTSNVPEKRKAAEALGQIGDESALDSLIIALQFDSNEGVRSSAAEALGMLNDRRALNMLIRSLHSDASPIVRASAAKALEWMGDPAAVDALIVALTDSHSDVRFRAAQALRGLRDVRAVEPLRALLDDPQTTRHVRGAAEQALEEISRQN
jgi:HEAT repeat protein